MTEIATFWNDKHPLAKKANELYDQLVPSQGSCATVEGELLRASTKISYDWFNNGWGCNNWSGAVRFIQEHNDFLSVTHEQRTKLLDELKYVYEFSHGEPSPHNEDRATSAVTTIHEIVVQGILNKASRYANNSDDMLNYSEEDYIPEEDEDDEYNDEEDDNDD